MNTKEKAAAILAEAGMADAEYWSEYVQGITLWAWRGHFYTVYAYLRKVVRTFLD